MKDNYDIAYFEPINSIQEFHFWFRARNMLIELLISDAIKDLGKGYKILELGCGTGNVLRVLEKTCKNGFVYGLDLFFEGLSFAKNNTNCPLVQADINSLPFRDKFDIIGIFDVLEHQPDDSRLLQDLASNICERGKLILTVPANKSLWSYFDVQSGHYRRYGIKELTSKLEQNGFIIEYATYFMSIIFPLIWIFRKFSSLWMKKNDGMSSFDLTMSEFKINPLMNKILLWLVGFELKLLSRKHVLPFGSSLLIVSHKNRINGD